jgi:hypothetical protein
MGGGGVGCESLNVFYCWIYCPSNSKNYSIKIYTKNIFSLVGILANSKRCCLQIFYYKELDIYEQKLA